MTDPDDDTTFGRALRARRRHLGLHQDELAGAMARSQPNSRASCRKATASVPSGVR